MMIFLTIVCLLIAIPLLAFVTFGIAFHVSLRKHQEVKEKEMAQVACPFCGVIYGLSTARAAYRECYEQRQQIMRSSCCTITWWKEQLDVRCDNCQEVARHPHYKGFWRPEEQEHQHDLELQEFQVRQVQLEAERQIRQALATVDPTYGFGDTQCDGCKQRLATWADTTRSVCGYCGRALTEEGG